MKNTFSETPGGVEEGDWLQAALLDAVWAGAASGFGTLLLNEWPLRRAEAEELRRLARRQDLLL